MPVDLLPAPAPRQTPVRAMTIAGSDSGGGAGIQADMRTMAMCGVHGCVAVTAVTVQNSLGVSGFSAIDPAVVADQMRSVVSDIGISAAKTGMLASSAIIESVAATASELGIGRDTPIPLVVDPVSASMHGDKLLADDAMDALRSVLIPKATVVTPNLDEVRLITGIDVTDDTSQRAAAEKLHAMGAQWAVVKGGHLRSSDQSVDLLYNGDVFHSFPYPRIDTGDDHGAGDTLAAAITCALAHGRSVPEAVEFAKGWVSRCLEWAYPLGAGHGPVNPLWRLSV
nr:bifunctional hydroxymethylpyrimidine kinase/phosphomethylpyrimidine kinase [Gordonia jinhuaensis]